LTTEQGLVGRRFGAYDVLAELGSGGMGRVYRAKNVALDRIVALKTLAHLFASDEVAVLSGSFNRMRISLMKALKMLEGE